MVNFVYLYSLSHYLWPPRGWETCQSPLQTCSALYLDPKLCLACGGHLINNCKMNWTIFSNLYLWFSKLDTITTGQVGTLELMQCCPPLLSISVSFLEGCIPFEFCCVPIIMSLMFGYRLTPKINVTTNMTVLYFLFTTEPNIHEATSKEMFKHTEQIKSPHSSCAALSHVIFSFAPSLH